MVFPHFNHSRLETRSWWLMVLFCVLLFLSRLVKGYSESQERSEPSYFLTSSSHDVHLWPKPREVIFDSQQLPYVLMQNLSIDVANDKLKQCDIIRFNLEKHQTILNKRIQSLYQRQSPLCRNSSREESVPVLAEILLLVGDHHSWCDQWPQFSSLNHQTVGHHSFSESYTIDIQPQGKALLYAESVWGAIRALETFSQLFYVGRVETAAAMTLSCDRLQINVGRIQDRPRFTYRSLMIDTSRHFLPTALILKNLEAMSINKMNILHWHLSDDQSFPFKSETFKNFTRFGAFSSQAVYTKTDIRLVVERARLHGIEVILEVDMPAHGQAFGRVFPGMDDVFPQCWNNDPTIKQWFQRSIQQPENQSANTMNQVEQYFIEKISKIIREKFRLKPIVWQDPLDKNLKMADDTIVQVWKDRKLLNLIDPNEWSFHLERLVRKNYTVVLSSCYFISLIGYGKDWKDFYACDPHDFNGSDREKRLVLGGEACVWGEYVDENNFLTTTWPRASAVAERLWSENIPDLQDEQAIEQRLDAQRCRMVKRGIPSQPISPGFCDRDDHADSNFFQPTQTIDDNEIDDNRIISTLWLQSSKKIDQTLNEANLGKRVSTNQNPDQKNRVSQNEQAENFSIVKNFSTSQRKSLYPQSCFWESWFTSNGLDNNDSENKRPACSMEFLLVVVSVFLSSNSRCLSIFF